MDFGFCLIFYIVFRVVSFWLCMVLSGKREFDGEFIEIIEDDL